MPEIYMCKSSLLIIARCLLSIMMCSFHIHFAAVLMTAIPIAVVLHGAMMLCYVTVKTVVSIDRIRMLKTDCSGETRRAPHVPSSLSWKAF